MRAEYNKELAAIALGERKADLVIKNANIVQVLTNEIILGDVAIHGGVIVGVGEYEGVQEINVDGQYVCPGFIDAHLHLESTLVNPAELIHCASRQGTTTFIVDPHEAANVSGLRGIDYILDETADSMANVYVMMPSCVPSTEFEDNGCSLHAVDMRSYVNHPRILGLGEVMDCDSVLSAKPAMLEKLNLFHHKIMDGHAGYLGDKQTGCYALSGISTDHECCSFEDALREMRAGIHVLVREGTAAKNLEAIMRGVIKHKLPCHQLAFCTDDKHIEEIQTNGHISNNVRKSIALGLSPMEAIKIATLYPATCYGLENQGAIAPGYEANLLVLSDLNEVKVSRVFYKGIEIQEQLERNKREIPGCLLNTVHVTIKDKDELNIPMERKMANVIELIPGEILTKRVYEEVSKKSGLFVADEIYQKIAVLERHHGTGNIGLGIVKGFYLHGGAIASTVGHDSHNVIVIGDNDEDMLAAIKELEQCGGGYTIVQHGQKPMTLKLEVMGLISRESYEVVNETLGIMIKVAHQMGIPETTDPFITLSFLALPVIPGIRVTSRGIYDVVQRQFIKLEEE